MLIKRTRRNKFFIWFLCIFIGGYFLLFSSNIWFPERAKLVSATEMNQKKEWKNREFTLLDWTYSKESNEMEVKIEILNKAMDGNDAYRYEAIERKKGFLQVEPVVEEADFLVLQIKNVQRWKEISLRIYLSEEKTECVKFYTNVDSVKNVSKIEVRTENEYQIERINEKIGFYEREIEKFSCDIKKLNQLLLNQDRDIGEMKKKEEFQTEEQIKEMEGLIANAEAIKRETKKEIEEVEKQALEYQERIEKLKKERATYE